MLYGPEWATSVLFCLWIRTLERKRFLRAIFSRYHVLCFLTSFRIPLPVCLNCWFCFPCRHIPGSWPGRCILTSEGQAWSQHHQLTWGADLTLTLALTLRGWLRVRSPVAPCDSGAIQRKIRATADLWGVGVPSVLRSLFPLTGEFLWAVVKRVQNLPDSPSLVRQNNPMCFSEYRVKLCTFMAIRWCLTCHVPSTHLAKSLHSILILSLFWLGFSL